MQNSGNWHFLLNDIHKIIKGGLGEKKKIFQNIAEIYFCGFFAGGNICWSAACGRKQRKAQLL